MKKSFCSGSAQTRKNELFMLNNMKRQHGFVAKYTTKELISG